jgi:hypothetical protein
LQYEQLEVAVGGCQFQLLSVQDSDGVTVLASEIGESMSCIASSVTQPADSVWCQHLIEQLEQWCKGGGLVEQIAAEDNRPCAGFGLSPVQQSGGAVVAVISCGIVSGQLDSRGVRNRSE